MSNLEFAVFMTTTLWTGLILGISFVAQPAKFNTPQLSLPVALAIGRRIFNFMHISEAVLAVVSISLVFASERVDNGFHTANKTCLFFAVFILLIQSRLLMPILSKRVDALLAGKTLTPTRHHKMFGVLEIAKLSLLIIFAWSLLNLQHIS